MTGDTCPTCGQPMPGAARDDCVCGDSVFLHRFVGGQDASSGVRSTCSRMSCDCKTYRPLGVTRDG